MARNGLLGLVHVPASFEPIVTLLSMTYYISISCDVDRAFFHAQPK